MNVRNQLALVILNGFLGIAGCQPDSENNYSDKLSAVTLKGLERVSVNAMGVEGNKENWICGLSEDGRYVVFQSDADNLVPGDTNGLTDVFLWDRRGTIKRISTGPMGLEGDGRSYCHAPKPISSDGRYVVFESAATNLLGTGVDTNKYPDIFLYDTLTAKVSIVSAPSGFPGVQSNGSNRDPSISADGKYLVFISAAANLVMGDASGFAHVYRYEVSSGTIEPASVSSKGNPPNSTVLDADLNADGRYVAFDTFSNNLDPGDTDTNMDVYVRDMTTGTTTLVSKPLLGTKLGKISQSPSISGDGTRIAFVSEAENLIANDTNNALDVFVYDTTTKTMILVSVASDGTQGNLDSGGWIVGTYIAGDPPRISPDGMRVVFVSDAGNIGSLPVGMYSDTYYVHDFSWNVTQELLRSKDGLPPNNDGITEFVFSPQGSLMGVSSRSSDLVDGDTNDTGDVFIGPNALMPNPQFFIDVPSAGGLHHPWERGFYAGPSVVWGGNITDFDWDFGDKTKDSGLYTKHIFTVGTYHVTLTVTSSDGYETQIQKTVIIDPAPWLPPWPWPI